MKVSGFVRLLYMTLICSTGLRYRGPRFGYAYAFGLKGKCREAHPVSFYLLKYLYGVFLPYHIYS